MTDDATPDELAPGEDMAGDELAALRRRVLQLGEKTLDALEADLSSRASLTQRNTAMRLVAPFLLRSLEARDDDSAMKAMQEAFTALMKQVMESPDAPTAITGREPGQVDADTPEPAQQFPT